jgi:hypothetical protein
MFPDRLDEEHIHDQAQQRHQEYGRDHCYDGIQSHLLGNEKDAVCRQHVKGGVGDIDDSGYPENQGKADGEKGVHAAADQTADEDIDRHITVPDRLPAG